MKLYFNHKHIVILFRLRNLNWCLKEFYKNKKVHACSVTLIKAIKYIYAHIKGDS